MTDPTPPEPEITDEEAAELLAFLDGTLPAERLAAVEHRLARDPALAAAVGRRRAAADAIHRAVADTAAPHDLRLRIDAVRSGAESRRARRRPRWLPVLALAGVASVAAAVVVVALGGAGLSVSDTVAAALRPPVAAVSVDPRRPALLREKVDEVSFPNFRRKFPWTPIGARADVIEGRRTGTVFYERAGRRIAYTIVSGDALDPPDGRPRVLDGVELRVLRVGDRAVVTWRRQGRTCVLSGRGVGEAELLGLAAWKGAGAVQF